ncbi:hypothetical protein SHIRM173S_05680 [Streptomyces hirsutus]
MKAIRRFTVRPVLPDPLRPLSDLARNLRWSWHTPTGDLFQSVDPECWAACGRDPVRLLGSVGPSGSPSWPATARSWTASTRPRTTCTRT